MDIRKMKILAESNTIRKAEAMQEAGGWAVWITHTNMHGEQREPLTRQRGGVRIFTTLEAVAHVVAGAGLREFRVHVEP